jgi:hypothetical protein
MRIVRRLALSKRSPEIGADIPWLGLFLSHPFAEGPGAASDGDLGALPVRMDDRVRASRTFRRGRLACGDQARFRTDTAVAELPAGPEQQEIVICRRSGTGDGMGRGLGQHVHKTVRQLWRGLAIPCGSDNRRKNNADAAHESDRRDFLVNLAERRATARGMQSSARGLLAGRPWSSTPSELSAVLARLRMSRLKGVPDGLSRPLVSVWSARACRLPKVPVPPYRWGNQHGQ